MNLGDELQLNLTHFQSLTHFVPQTVKYRKDLSCQSKQLFMAARHHHMKASQHAHKSTYQAALHPPLCIWPKCPGHAALHALESVCSSIIWSRLYTMWLLRVHLHEGIPEGPQLHMKQRCLCCSHAVVPARTYGVLFGEDRSGGMPIHGREQSLNGSHLEQASYTVMQEERSMFWNAILMVTIRKKFIWKCV